MPTLRPRTVLHAALILPLLSGIAAAQSGGEAMVDRLLELTGVHRAVCVMVDPASPRAIEDLIEQSEWFVHVWEPDADKARALQAMADERNYANDRLVIETGPLTALPHTDRLVDVVLVPDASEDLLKILPAGEVLRVLRPKGHAIIGQWRADAGLTPDMLKTWLGDAEVGQSRLLGKAGRGTWLHLTAPALEGIDTWSHWERGPDNNPVSQDQVIKTPYMTQFLGLPYYISMPAITTAAGGRIFMAMGHIAHHEREEPWLNTLVARNGYNGTILWTRKLPDGYLAHRSAFVATEETFHMIAEDGGGVLLLDPETGVQKDRLNIVRGRGDIKWIAMQDGILYALVGREKDPPQTTVVRSENPHWSWGELSQGYYDKRVPWGFGTQLVAYDTASRTERWSHKEPKPMDSRSIVMGGGKIFFYGPDSHVAALDAESGQPLWSNSDPEVREMVEKPGKGLGSTPGFRTMCYALYTPKALCFEAQTRANVVALSPETGKLLWTHKKTTNNPNMLYLDGMLLVGIGDEGETLVVEPESGEIVRELGFKKRSCARLTATADSLFCRGWPEGLTRFDREKQEVVFNGAFRPSCNDGLIAANGMAYAGPWACDCNLTLMGRLGMCSAGDFRFDFEATNEERLEVFADDPTDIGAVAWDGNDWPMYRRNLERSASTPVKIPDGVIRLWSYQPEKAYAPTAPVATVGLVLVAGEDGKVRAMQSVNGEELWTFTTAGPIKQPPTLWEGRVYLGSGDGYVYALEAHTGKLLWRFRAAPIERRIMAYGNLLSTWPVNTGVLIHDGVAYFAAGLIDTDGTYVYAVDAKTGELVWQNNGTGHLDRKLRKGVSAQGILTVANGKLYMAGGNVINPAVYDLKTGEYLGAGPGDGSPQANRGQELGLFMDDYLMVGGRLMYSARSNVVNSGQFELRTRPDADIPKRGKFVLRGQIPPAWNDEQIVFTPWRKRSPEAATTASVIEYMNQDVHHRGEFKRQWKADLPDNSDVNSLVLGKGGVLAVVSVPVTFQINDQWRLYGLDGETGQVKWFQRLPGEVTPGGLLVDQQGRVVVVQENGTIQCYGDARSLEETVDTLVRGASDPEEGRKQAIASLMKALNQAERNMALREAISAQLQELGYELGEYPRSQGFLTNWYLAGTVPFNGEHPFDRLHVDPKKVDVNKPLEVDRAKMSWKLMTTNAPDGRVEPMLMFGELDTVAIYAYSEFILEKAMPLKIKLGSDDGFICWVNGDRVREVNVFRGYVPDSDVAEIQGHEGVNRVLLKITQDRFDWMFGARLTDMADKPLDVNQLMR